MWDHDGDDTEVLPHDLPCPRCGHPMHTYLPCDEHCACPPYAMPGSRLLVAS